MKIIKPRLPGEHDPNACAFLCGRTRAYPAIVCAQCLAEADATEAEERRRHAQEQLDDLFADGRGVYIELIQLRYLSKHMDPALYRFDKIRGIFYRTKQEELRNRRV